MYILKHSKFTQYHQLETQDPTYLTEYAQIGKLKGRGQALRKLIYRIKQLAPSQLSILIQGETGSGKELCAQAIHQYSKRANTPLISVNCAAIAPNLLSVELFGSVAHAYTDAQNRPGLIMSASNGTLFLDEVADLSLEAQAALLRVLESGELRPVGSDQIKKVDIRLICASHKQLDQMVLEGTFRADLYHRLSGVTLSLPPLRNRLEDLPELVAQFSPSVFSRLTHEAWRVLHDFAWPGNIRQLKNLIACIEIEHPHHEITASQLPLPAYGPWRSFGIDEQEEQKAKLFEPRDEKFLVTGSPYRSEEQPQPPIVPPPAHTMALYKEDQSTSDDMQVDQQPMPFDLRESCEPNLSLDALFNLLPPLTLDELKQRYVLHILDQQQGNISESARLLSISRSFIYRILESYSESKVA